MVRIWLSVFAFPFVLAASGPDSALWGVVEDASGALVPDAVVVAFNEDTGVRRSASTVQEGRYAISAIPSGKYKILARKPGFFTAARTGIAVRPQQTMRCDFVLHIGPVEQVINVEGGPPLLNSEDGSMDTIFGRNYAEQLTRGGRSLMGLLDLVPGIINTPANSGEAGQFSATGQRPNSNYFTVDGVSFNTGVSGAGLPGLFPGGTLPAMTAIGSLHNLASADAIDEVRVQTSGFTPEFGRLPGAQVTIATRSGSNDFHGSIFEAFQTRGLAANDWFANAAGVPSPTRRVNDFVGSFGGPIRRNRTFFFMSYEQMDLRQPYLWRTAVPSQAVRESAPRAVASVLAAFPMPNGPPLGSETAELTASAARPAQLRVGNLRIDHAITPKVNLFTRFSASPSSSEVGYSQVNRSDFDETSLTAGVTGVFGSRGSNDLRVNVTLAAVWSSWTSTHAGGAGSVDLTVWAPWADTSFRSISISGLGKLVSGNGGENMQNQFNLVDTLALSRGAHHLRMGADYQRLTPDQQGPTASLSVDCPSLSDLVSTQSAWLTYSQSQRAADLLHTMSLFLQDTWTITPSLTMTAGARWEIAPAPSLKQGHLIYSGLNPLTPTAISATEAGAPIWRTRLTNVAPRVGLAYRFTPNGASILRAGFGIFYDTGFAATTDQVNGMPYNSWQAGPPNAIGAQPSAAMVLYGFDSDLHLPRFTEWNLTWQRVWGNWGVTDLSYVGSQGSRLLRREALLSPTNEIAKLELATSHGRSSYGGMQAGYRRRLTNGLGGLLSYTWSHAIDTGSWDSSVFLVGGNLAASRDRASANFDARHVFAAAINYEIGLERGPRFLTRNWTTDIVFHARTAFPVDVLAAETLDGFNFANVIRPDLIPGIPVWTADANAPRGRRLNPAAFSLPANSLQGTLGRNAIRGFGMAQLDFAIRKSFVVNERASLHVGAEVSNISNTPQFADPVHYLASPLFGEATSGLNLMLGGGSPHSGLTPALQIGSPRSLQLSLRLLF